MTEPDLIQSSLSRKVEVEDHTLQIEIYRIDTEPRWSLEVVDEDGNSTVWDDRFDTDRAALVEAMKTIEEEGVSAFQEMGQILSFPKN